LAALVIPTFGAFRAALEVVRHRLLPHGCTPVAMQIAGIKRQGFNKRERQVDARDLPAHKAIYRDAAGCP
jgi:hypothetical protein